MLRALLLALAAAAAAAAGGNPPLATLELRVNGTTVNDTLPFVALVDDALALAVGWLSVDALRRSVLAAPAPCDVATGSPRAQRGKSTQDDRKKRPPPPAPAPAPRRARRVLATKPPVTLQGDTGCRTMTLAYTVTPDLPPSVSEFDELPAAIRSGAVANEMRLLGVPVDSIDVRQLTVNDTMLSKKSHSENPVAATGNNAVRFNLRLVGPDATFGMQDMLRDLLLMVAHNLTTTTTDYVSIANSRIVKVAFVDQSPAALAAHVAMAPSAAGPAPGDAGKALAAAATAAAVAMAAPAPSSLPKAPQPPPAGRRALAQAASPPAPPPSRLPAAEPLALGKLKSDPALDATFEITHLPPKGVRAVFDSVHLLAGSGYFARTLQADGFRLDSVRLAPGGDAFTVNGRPFDGGNTLMDRAALGDVAPLALTIAIPVLAAVAGLITVTVLWHKHQAKRGRRFFGGDNRLRSLVSAVTAARKGDTAAAAEMLLGDSTKKGITPKGSLDRLDKDWQLDPASIDIQRDAGGTKIVLGAGAAGTVYRGLLNGVQDVAIKVFKEPLAALAPAPSGLTTRSSGSVRAGAPRTASARTAAKPRALQLWRRSAPDGAPKSDARGAALKPSPSTVDGAAADAAVGSTAPGPKSAAAARQLEELAREVVLMRACRDRNLVSFVGACITPGTGHPIIVSELLHNGDLFKALDGDDARRFGWARARGPNGRPLPNTGLSRRVALDVARGLAALHSRGVVHLDLKSPNILLSRAWEAKIADYGVSRVLRDSFLSTLPTAAGTLCWAAPEVLLGRPVNEKADIYSFGVVLWELSAREPPRGRCQRPLEDDEAPRVVADMIARCTAENPDDRPSAADLVNFFKSLDEDGHAPGKAGAAAGAAAKVMRALSTQRSRRASDAAPTAERRPVGVEAVDVEAGDGAPASAPEPEPPRPTPAVVPAGGFAAAAAEARRPPVVPAGGFAAAAAAADPAPPPPAAHGKNSA